MTEIKTRLVTKRVDYMCDDCSEGFMIRTGALSDSDPAQFIHRCDKCKKEKPFCAQYPHIVYEEL